MTTHTTDVHCEETVLSYLRTVAQLHDRGNYATQTWNFPSAYHLLLRHGRRFSPAAAPADLAPMDRRQCFSNAARYAARHPGLVYAEGYALPHEVDAPLAHAWCTRPDGTVLDPTWTDSPGRAYIGLAFGAPQLWPHDGGGILNDPDRSHPLLQNGLPDGTVLDEVGRTL
ncbi:hypothetical protein [Streptomyces sp. NPDC101455]|uniref:hypothetical protein n=1 Tax=Streptomyces sp. NPDC101455 TaxID=3366142 RepID=UPI0037FF3C25